MTNVYRLPSNEERMDEASQWIARLDKILSADEEESLQAWMAADPENRNALLKMAALWDSMDSLSRLVDLFPEPAGRSAKRFTFEPAWIGVVVLAIFSGVWITYDTRAPNTEEQTENGVEPSRINEYQTAIGEYSSVTLQDGTQLVLNTDSLVRVNYSNDHRLVVLEKGEVNIKVASEKGRPFSVVAGDRIVQAVGTEFNIEITSDQQVELVVTEGKVLVGVHKSRMNQARVTAPILMASSAVTVLAGEELLLGSSDESVTEVDAEEIEVKLSWREGNLIFRGESLEEAVTEIGRYTSVEFVFLDDDLKQVRIAGLFRPGDVDGLLATLRENFDITYERDSDGVVLLSSRK